MICIGEGEEVIVELCDKLEKDKDITNIKNLWLNRNGRIIKNPIRPVIENLDLLPFPDYDLFNLENLFYTKIGYIERSC